MAEEREPLRREHQLFTIQMYPQFHGLRLAHEVQPSLWPGPVHAHFLCFTLSGKLPTEPGMASAGGIFEEAVRMKSAMVDHKCRAYKARAPSLQHSIFHLDQYKDGPHRNANETECLEWAEGLKAEGNSAVGEKDWNTATLKYERALGLLRFIVSSREDWRSNLADVDLAVVDSAAGSCCSLDGSRRPSSDFGLGSLPGFSEAGKRQAARLCAALYGNLCTVALAQGQASVAAAEAAEGLRVTPGHPKLLMKRAKSWMQRKGAGTTELRAALLDLKTAVDMFKQAGDLYDVGSRVLSQLAAAYKEHASMAAAQHAKDKAAFAGLFERGSIVQAAEESEAAPTLPAPHSRLPDTTRAQLAAMRRARAEAEAEGRVQDAKELSVHLSRAEARLAAGAGLEPSLDFSKPTPEMRSLAEEMGLDLDDPAVQRELEVVDAQAAAKRGFASAAGAAAAASTGTLPKSNAPEVTLDELEEHIRKMPLPALVEFMVQQDIASEPTVRGWSEQQVREKAVAMLRSSEDPMAGERKARYAMVRYIAFTAICLFMLWRLYNMGLLTWLFTGQTPAGWGSQAAIAAASATGATSAAQDAVPAYPTTSDSDGDAAFGELEVDPHGRLQRV